MDLDQLLLPELIQRQQQQRYRIRHRLGSPQAVKVVMDGHELVNFCSNDYLGLASDRRVRSALAEASLEQGVGSGAAHLVCGHSDSHHALEDELAELVQRPRALLFSTGYMANLGAVISLCNQQDWIFADKLNHASLNDAALLARSEFRRYRHLDNEHLARFVQPKPGRRRLILTDTVFSMDGDEAPLAAMAELAQNSQSILMVDDAHGLGVLGPQGRGSVLAQGLTWQQVPVLVGTLGKALGTFGAFVAGSEALIETLIQFARTYIYTTALPPAVAQATRVSLAIAQREDWRRHNLLQLIERLQQQARHYGLPLMPSATAIQPILVGSSAQAVALSDGLKQRGFWVSAIRPPTVPQGEARLRITLNALHQTAQVDALMAAIAELWPLVKEPI